MLAIPEITTELDITNAIIVDCHANDRNNLLLLCHSSGEYAVRLPLTPTAARF